MAFTTHHSSLITAVLILGHGSPIPEANNTLREVAKKVQDMGGYDIVQPAFLQFARPDFSEAVEILVKQGVQRIIVHPYFLYTGAHVRKDLPLQVKAVKGRYPDLEIILAPHLGYHDKLIEVVVERIEEAMGQGSGEKDSGQWSVVSSKERNPHAPCSVPHAPLNQHPIEAESFRIIGEYLDESRFSPLELPIIKRVIHATGDFEYADLIRFGNNPIEAGLKAILRGDDIITDVRMVEVGINKERLDKFGSKVRCFISKEGRGAKGSNRTRTTIAMRKALDFGFQKNPLSHILHPTSQIIVIGNSPTALKELTGMIKDGKARPAIVIGVPVGFVGAEASKDELMRLPIPYISIRGKKGGSTVAVAIVNAMLMMAELKSLELGVRS